MSPMTRTAPPLEAVDETGSPGPWGGLPLARSTRGLERSGLRQILSETVRPGVRSFAIGMPGTDLLPAAELREAAAEALAADARPLQYGEPYAPLKRRVVELMARRGAPCAEDQVFLTAGAQQGMELIARLLLDPGDPVLLEETIYDGIQLAVAGRDPEVVPVPTAAPGGVDLDALESLLAGGLRPRFFYTVPVGHNPLGSTLPEPARRRLVALARRYRFPVVEDDVYGFLSYEEPAPPLVALDPEWVVYLGSFSKILAPGLRAGWMVVPEDLVPRLSIAKHAADVDTCTFGQRVLCGFLDRGLLEGHLARLRTAYRARRDAMLSALGRCFPAEARWWAPDSGLFVWVELPRRVDTRRLLRTAVDQARVAFCPGEAFALDGAGRAAHGMRLSFADATPDQIDEGMERLGRVVTAACR